MIEVIKGIFGGEPQDDGEWRPVVFLHTDEKLKLIDKRRLKLLKEKDEMIEKLKKEFNARVDEAHKKAWDEMETYLFENHQIPRDAGIKVQDGVVFVQGESK